MIILLYTVLHHIPSIREAKGLKNAGFPSSTSCASNSKKAMSTTVMKLVVVNNIYQLYSPLLFAIHAPASIVLKIVRTRDKGRGHLAFVPLRGVVRHLAFCTSIYRELSRPSCHRWRLSFAEPPPHPHCGMRSAAQHDHT